MTIQSTHKLNDQNYSRIREQIREWGDALELTLGFTTPIIPSKHIQHLNDWLADGHHGNMTFFEQNMDIRTDPTKLQPNTLSIISARLNYWDDKTYPAQSILNDPTKGYISRYALGRDYHKVLRQKLKALCQKIATNYGDFQWRPFTDSAPIMEHALAEQAGLGFIGKHTLLIHPEVGSTFFLGEILCNLPLPPDIPTKKNACGSCTNCIKDCPTDAIVAPFTVDARRCISYLTIEHKGIIPLELRSRIGNRIYGCDDCQLTCPWNKFSKPHKTPDFGPRHQLDNKNLLDLWSWSEPTFLMHTEGSPIRRIGFEQWRRNLSIALGNAPYDPEIVRQLNDALTNATDLLQEHIQWAIQRQSTSNKTIPKIKRYYIQDVSLHKEHN